MWSACASTIANSFWTASGVSSFVEVCVGDHPGICDDLGALFPRCPGRTLFVGRCIVETYDSAVGVDVALEEEAGGQPTSPLTAVLPDAAMRLWTTLAATGAGLPTG